MTLDEAGDIFTHWKTSPPTHRLVGIIAQMLGWKLQAAPRVRIGFSSEQLKVLTESGAVKTRDVHEGLGQVLSFAELSQKYRESRKGGS